MTLLMCVYFVVISCAQEFKLVGYNCTSGVQPRGRGTRPPTPARPVHEIRVNSMRNVCTPHPCPKPTYHDDGSATLMSPDYGNYSLFTSFDNCRLSIILLIIPFLFYYLLKFIIYVLRTRSRHISYIRSFLPPSGQKIKENK